MNRLPTRRIRIRQLKIAQIWPRMGKPNMRGCVYRNALKDIRREL